MLVSYVLPKIENNNERPSEQDVQETRVEDIAGHSYETQNTSYFQQFEVITMHLLVRFVTFYASPSTILVVTTFLHNI